jgi:hypothetical protein
MNMPLGLQRIAAICLLAATESWAHPGHNATLGHLHAWDWGYLLLGIAIAVGVALAIWKAR